MTVSTHRRPGLNFSEIEFDGRLSRREPRGYARHYAGPRLRPTSFRKGVHQRGPDHRKRKSPVRDAR